MTKEELKQYIDENVYENPDGDITGESLNEVLKAIVDNAGTKVEANPTGTPTETLGKIKIGETIYTAPQGPQGEPGPANTLSIGTVQSGQTAAASITGEAPNQVLNLTLPKGEQGDPGQNAVNPFKGWFTTDNIPTEGQAGDYCNVSTTTQPETVTIYRWNTTTNQFEDTGEVPDTATGETFASSETLQQVAIDDSHLVDPVNTADSTQPVLAQAADVMQLKAKLEGVTAHEVKATPTSTGTIGNYIKPDNTEGSVSQSDWQWGVFNVVGCKSVRFLALNYISSITPVSGWLFLDDLDNIKGGETYTHTASSTTTKELVIPVPPGATKFKTNIAGSLLTNNFYCYLQSGDTVKDMVDGVVDKLSDYVEITDDYGLDNGFLFDTTGSGTWRWNISNNNKNHISIPVKSGEIYKIENNSPSSPNIRYVLSTSSNPTRPSSNTSYYLIDYIDLPEYRRIFVVNAQSSNIFVIPEGVPEKCYLCVNHSTSYLSKVYKKEVSLDTLRQGIAANSEAIAANSEKIDTIEDSLTTKVDYNFTPYEEDFVNNTGVISNGSGNWQTSTAGGHYIFNIPNGTKYVKIIGFNSGYANIAYYALLNQYEYNEGDTYPTSTYATGYSTTKKQSSKSLIITVPNDAHYLYTNRYAVKVEFSFRKTTKGIIGGFIEYSKKRKDEQNDILRGNSVTNHAIKTDSNGNQLSTSRQIDILLEKARIMSTFTWTPKIAGRIPKSYTSTPAYYNTDQQTGIPYSGNRAMTVGFGVSLYTFRTAVDNKYSLMYTENMFTGNSSNNDSGWNVLDEETYGKVVHDKTNNHCNSYYGTYCNGFSALCTGLDIPLYCGSYGYNSKYFGDVSKVANQYKDIRIGDVFTKPSPGAHTILVTGVKFDNDRNVTSLTITEAAGGSYRVVEKPPYTGDSLNSYLDDLKSKYEHYRVDDICRKWDLDDMMIFDANSYQEPTEVCTFAGDKATFLKGDMVVINFNVDNDSNFTATYLHLDILTDDGWQEVTSQEISQIPNQSYPQFDYVNDFINHCWAIPQEYLDGGVYRVYANNGTSATQNPSKATYFEVLTEDYQLIGSGDDVFINYTGNGSVYGAYLYVNTDVRAILPISNEEKEGQYVEIHPETFCYTVFSKYNGETDFYFALFIRGEYGCVRTNLISYSSVIEEGN